MEDKPFRISILGIGAVGGYFGGLLAEKYFNSDLVEITFITRSNTEKIIKSRGLKIIFPDGEKVVFPDHVTSDPATIKHIDLLICCVKSYDLEESLKPLVSKITSNTIILPLLNGIDSKSRIQTIFPHCKILNGCVYIVTRLVEPGVIRESGNIHSLYFGSSEVPKEKLKKIEFIFRNAQIDAFLSENIEKTIWDKFLFISSIASLTSYLDLPIGGILENPSHKDLLYKLLSELIDVANKKGIYFEDDIKEKVIAKMKSLPYETTSSMHSDLKKGGRTEWRSLTEHVVQSGIAENIETPVFSIISKSIKSKITS